MNLMSSIKNELQQKDGVYYIKDYCSFNYSDGDEVENYIYSVINNANDISCNSRELEEKIKDWPSLYHLSRERSIAYKSLDLPPQASVLEVGCGCGAITRFLGENVAHVLALEGSPRRAAIARARTRDLESVSVLCASFEDVVFNGLFDVIVCNGVLEYAPLFVKHEDPAREFIRLLTSLLNPGGNLIVAIENKLGLRYFSSGKEEHTNIMFDGLEGYARFPEGPNTFGFSELHGLLSEHCEFVETFLPLPDYKLPTALIRAELLDEVNCADLFATVTRHDFGTYEEPRMHERLVWQELHKNHLMKTFANSYFMIAGHEEIALFRKGWMGDIYALKRNADLMIRTTISKQKSGEIVISKNHFEREGTAAPESTFRHVLDESPWIDGVSIHTIISRAMLRSGAKVSLEERLRNPVIGWWDEISTFRLNDGTFQGVAFDCIWQNAILKDGKVHFIDKEWVSNDKIDPMSIIYRSVAIFMIQECYYLRRWNRSCQRLNEMTLLRAVARLLGIDVTFQSVINAMNCNLDLLERIHGTKTAGFRRSSRLCVLFARLFVPFNVLKYKNDTIRRSKAIAGKFRYLFRRLSGRR
jgi:2-polyprenyl-3-methyl-5-hydroxy-6-metoxy-1,4-benzoquinol methylase